MRYAIVSNDIITGVVNHDGKSEHPFGHVKLVGPLPEGEGLAEWQGRPVSDLHQTIGMKPDAPERARPISDADFEPPDFPAEPPKEEEDWQPHVDMQAVHRGRGSYSVMRDDEELVEGLKKKEAQEFNDMSVGEKTAYVESKT